MRAGRVAVVGAAVLAVGLSPALAPVVPPRAEAAGPGASLVVAPRGGGVLEEDAPLDVDVEVRNTGTTRLSAGRLTVSMTAGPVASASELFVTPTQLQGLLLTRSSASTPALDPGASTQVRIRVPVKDLKETMTSANGARVLDVQLLSGATRVLAQSAVTRMAGDAPRIGFGTVVPITIPAGTTGIVDAAQQATLTASEGDWTRALAAAEAMPGATIALDPAVVASIRLAGAAAPASATAFLDELRDAGNETVRLAYADGDVTLQRAAGVSAPLPPKSFAGSTAAATSADAAAATPAATPAPTPTPTPGTEDLTDWDWSSTRVVWPVPGTTAASDLTALGRDAAVLLGSSDLKDSLTRAAAGPMATVSGQRVLVADATTSGLLATATADGLAGRSAAASLAAVLATDAVTGAAPTVLAVAGRGADGDGLSRVLGLLGRQRWIRGEGLGALEKQVQTVEVQLKPGSIPTGRVTTARSLITAEAGVARVADAAADPAALAGPYRLSLLGVLSAEWQRDDQGWATASATARSAFEAMPRMISIQNAGPVTPIGTDGQLKVQVENALPQPVRVVVTATVDNNRLKFDSPGQVTVPANATGQARLSFRSISNGTSIVTLSLATPKGSPFGVTQEQPVTVRAGFDTIVAVILLTALGLLLALGVYRNVTRRRRPRAER